MRLSRVIRRHIRRQAGGVNIAADVSAVVAANADEPGTTRTMASSRSTIVQRGSGAPEPNRPVSDHDKEDSGA
jgi:hypothetical protein